MGGQIPLLQHEHIDEIYGASYNCDWLPAGACYPSLRSCTSSTASNIISGLSTVFGPGVQRWTGDAAMRAGDLLWLLNTRSLLPWRASSA